MTQIIATLGPKSYTPEIIKELFTTGVSIFRLNFSHGEHLWHKTAIEMIREYTPNAKIMLDTKGPEVRTGDTEHPIKIKQNEIVHLISDDKTYKQELKYLFVNHAGLHNDVEKGDKIAINSGKIILEVLKTTDRSVSTKSLHDGIVRSRRHVNLIEKDVSLPTLTDSDIRDINFGIEHNIDIIALSFVRSAQGVRMTEELIKKQGKTRKDIKIWSKIESRKALNNLEEICKESDGVMVARGDLGVETPLEEVPYRQQDIIQCAKKNNAIVIVATEMLESMITTSRPTRAEVTDISLAVWQGADYTMLSGESAAGKYPAEAVRVMKSIIDIATKNTGYIKL